jgi:SAM-dependent methyltransferase
VTDRIDSLATGRVASDAEGVDHTPGALPHRPFRATRFLVEKLYGARGLIMPALDAIDLVVRRLRGQADFPPLSARQLVSGTFRASVAEFEAVGRAEARSWEDTMGLLPEHTVLDIGCGCGRVARHLLERLRPPGRYLGADVDARAIEWCQGRLAARHAGALFFHIDAFNSIYNPGSRRPASDYRFPVPDGSVDRIGLSSVFTHMLPEDVQSYLREIARMLAPGGCAYAGVFLLAPHRLAGEAGPVVAARFPFARKGYAFTSEKYPDLEVAYDLDAWRSMVARAGLTLREPVLWGTWPGTEGYRPLDVALLDKAR